MRHTTCATLACDSPDTLLAELKKALAVSEYAELRLDFLEPRDVLAALDSCRDHLGRCVCTLRPESEGGRFRGTESERRDLLREIAGYGPYRLDVEYDAIREDRSLAAGLEGAALLVSWHDFVGTPDADALARRLDDMSHHSKHVKIVTTAQTAADPSRILSLYGMAGEVDLIAFCMGELGKISRLVCLYLGAPYTYVSLGRPVAPGQYSLEEIRSLEMDPEET